MTMQRCWARIIPVLWFSLAIPGLQGAPARLEQLGRAYAVKGTPANRAALAAYAKAHPATRDGALALLALAAGDIDRGLAREALESLDAAGARLAPLADYAAFFRARAFSDLERNPDALVQTRAVIAAAPASPLRAQAVLLEASIRSAAGTEDSRRAAQLIKSWIAELPQPRALAPYARALEAAGDLTAAAIEWQKLWYEYPLSPDAAEAGTALDRLRTRLGPQYPPAMPAAMLTRASLLIDGRQISKAKLELTAMLTSLAGEDRDRAQVRLGAAQYAAGANSQALDYLSKLSIPASEANAERLYYYLAAARRLDRPDDMQSALDALARYHPASPRRLEALVSAGNFYLLQNKSAEYEPIYGACADAFPNAPEAAYCHWKVAWIHYLQRRDTAGAMLREHLRRFPAGLNAPSALYFLGRLAEAESDPGAARPFYERIALRYPSYYYAGLARDRLQKLGAAPASKTAIAFLQSIEFPPPDAPGSFQPDAATTGRIERARLLASAGLYPQAEAELRFGARTDSRRQAIAVEIARLAQNRGADDLGIFYIRSLAPKYLTWSPREAPDAFWKLAYPFPYRETLEKYSRRHEVDSFLVAGLVRQESAFNPKAVSRANAIGLTQIVPSTGRQISRRIGVPYRSGMLSEAEPNLRLGTWHLRSMIDALGGDVAAALAAYNAGKSRADAWLKWGEFREQAEFIETIPFTETRDYIQIVLRNAATYRRLYAAAAPALPSTGGSSGPKNAGRAAAGPRRPGALP